MTPHGDAERSAPHDGPRWGGGRCSCPPGGEGQAGQLWAQGRGEAGRGSFAVPVTESGCARRLCGLCLRPRRQDTGQTNGVSLLLAWRRDGETGFVLGTRAACWAGQPASPGICSPAPLPRRARTPHGALDGRARGTDAHAQAWRMPEGVWAREDACGRVSAYVCSVAGLGAHLCLNTWGSRTQGWGTAGAQVGRTGGGHICLWLSELCTRGPLHTRRGR